MLDIHECLSGLLYQIVSNLGVVVMSDSVIWNGPWTHTDEFMPLRSVLSVLKIWTIPSSCFFVAQLFYEKMLVGGLLGVACVLGTGAQLGMRQLLHLWSSHINAVSWRVNWLPRTEYIQYKNVFPKKKINENAFPNIEMEVWEQIFLKISSKCLNQKDHTDAWQLPFWNSDPYML